MANTARFRERFVAFRSGYGFLLLLLALVMSWIAWNLLPWRLQFDPPPFISLNLLLSIEAAFAMPVLMMEGRASDEEMAGRVKEILKKIEEVRDE